MKNILSSSKYFLRQLLEKDLSPDADEKNNCVIITSFLISFSYLLVTISRILIDCEEITLRILIQLPVYEIFCFFGIPVLLEFRLIRLSKYLVFLFTVVVNTIDCCFKIHYVESSCFLVWSGMAFSKYFFSGERGLRCQWIIITSAYVGASTWFLIGVKEGIYIDKKALSFMVIRIIAFCLIGGYYLTSLQTSIRMDRCTILQKLKKQLEQALEEKQIFFSNITTEMRNSLQSLLGCLELMQDGETTDHTLIETAQVCGEVLLNLIGNILDVSKINENKLNIETAPADIEEVVKKVTTMCKSLAASKNLYLKYQFQKKMPKMLQFDTSRLIQVLLNILSNGIKFTEKGGVFINIEFIPIQNPNSFNTKIELQQIIQQNIEISTRQEILDSVEEMTLEEERVFNPKSFDLYLGRHMHSKYCICKKNFNSHATDVFEECKSVPVSPKHHQFARRMSDAFQLPNFSDGLIKFQIVDTGLGIAEENLADLFKPSKNIRRNSEEYHGTGIGLWISKKIINLMNGDIRMESEVGKGSNCIIVIPMKVMDEQQYLLQRAYSSTEIDGLRCLFVENNKSSQKNFRDMCERAGMSVFVASNGEEGLQIFRENRPYYFNVILTAAKLPRMNGNVMIDQIKKFEAAHNLSPTPIIAIANNAFEKERYQCMNLFKVNGFLQKPIKLSILRKAIAEARKSVKEMIKIESSFQEQQILIIDDDVICSKTVKTLLHKSGIASIQGYSILSGVKLYQKYHQSIGIIFIDGQLPDGGGEECLKAIRKYENDNDLEKKKIFSLSGNSIEAQKHQYRGLEVDEFLIKPVVFNLLKDLLSKYIQIKLA